MKNKIYVIGVDIGGTNTKIGIVNEDGEIILKEQIPTNPGIGIETCIDLITKKISEILEQSIKLGILVSGIGLGVTGQVDINTGKIVGGIKGKIPGWIGLPIKNIFEKKFNLPVSVDNDGNVAALAEYIFGMQDSVHSMVVLTIGTGIGCGIILDGKLFRGGGNNLSAELGHVSINVFGPICPCGKKGCLEAYISKEAIINMYKQKRLEVDKNNAERTSLSQKKEVISPELIYQKHLEGEKIATEVIHQVGIYLGYTIANAVNTIGPEIVVVGGGIAQFNEPLLNSARKTVEANVFGLASRDMKIILAKFGTFAGVIGASTLVMEKFNHITGIDNRIS